MIWTRFILTITQLIDMALHMYLYIVVIAAVLSWIEPNPYNPIVRAIYSMTEPVFDWVRRKLPVSLGQIDLSPVVVIFGIYFIQMFLLPTVREVAISGFN